MKDSCKRYALALLLALVVLCSGLAVLFGCSVDEIEEKRTVTFMNGEEVFAVQEVDLGYKYSFPEEVPVRDQPDDEHVCKFLGWTLDPNFYEYRSEILEEPDYVVGDLTIYAAFRTVEIAGEEGAGADLEYTVEFRMPRGEDFGEYSGKTLNSQTVKRYGSANIPDASEMPQIEGYHFTNKWEGGTLQDVRGHRRVTAVYEKNIYNYTWHYLDKTRTVEVEFRHEIDLTETPETEPAFKFDGWFMDEDFTVPATLSEVPAGNVDLYAKYRIDFSTASVSYEGRMVYGDESNKLYVSGLSYVDGLHYTFVWTVNGEQGGRTENSVYPLKNAGEYAVGVHIFANYKNGVLTDEGDVKDINQSKDLSFTLQKATLTAEVTLSADEVVYGQPAPAASIVYSGFQFGETAEEVGVDQDFVCMLGDDDVTGANLHVGLYRVETRPHALANYAFDTIAAPEFEVTKKALYITFTVSDYEYGTGFAPEINYDGFEYGDGSSVLGEHWFEVENSAANGLEAVRYHENDLIHAGSYSAELKGFASGDYEINLPAAENFQVAKRTASATLQAEGGTYGVSPEVGYTLQNVLPQDEERFSAEYTYKRSGNSYTALERFIVGNYTVTAKFTEDGSDYEPIKDLTQSFAVTPADLHIGVSVDGEYTYGDPVSPVTTFVDSEFKFGESKESLNGTGKYIYHTAAAPKDAYNGRLNVGSYTVEITGYSADNYNIIYDGASFEVTQKLLTLKVRLQNTELLYGETPQFEKGENIINGVEYDGFAYQDNANNVFNTLPKINYVIYGTQDAPEGGVFHADKYTATTSAEASNYKIEVVPLDFTVAKRSLYIGIQFGTETTLYYGSKPSAQIIYTKDGYDGFWSNERITFASAAEILYSGDTEDYNQSDLNLPTVKMIAGKYVLSVTGIKEGIGRDYDVTYQHEEGISFEIKPKLLTATITSDKQGYIYGEKPELSLALGGWAYNEGEADLFGNEDSHILIVRGESKSKYTNPVIMAAGNYEAVLAEANNPNYELKITTAEFGVSPKDLTIKVSMDDFEYGSDREHSVSKVGFIEGEDEKNLTGKLEISGLKTGAHYSAGSHTLTPSGYTSENYDITYVPATFQVSKKALTITVTAEDITYGDELDLTEPSFVGFIDGESQKDLIGDKLVYTYKVDKDGLPADAQLSASNRYRAGEYTLTLSGYTSENYDIEYIGDTFTVSPREVVVTMNEGWSTYAEDRTAAKEGYWYSVTQNIIGKELEFTLSITRDGNPYTHGSDAYYPAGKYNVAVSFNENSDYTVTGVTEKTFTVNKRDITISLNTESKWSKRGEWTFTPSKDIVPTDKFQFTGTIVLRDPENTSANKFVENEIGKTFKWQSNPVITVAGTDEDVTSNFNFIYSLNLTLGSSDFSIKKPEATVTYNKTAQSFAITATADGVAEKDITILYKTSEEAEYANEVPAFTDAGTYTIWYKVSAANCEDKEDSFQVTINRAKLGRPAASGKEFTYNKGDFTEIPTGYDPETMSIDGNVQRSAGTHDYTVSLRYPENYEWTDGGRDDVKLSFTINKAEVAVPSIAAKTYNASNQIADVDADNDLYTVTSNAGGINAQGYEVKLKLKDSNNYKWSDGREEAEITLTFVIKKAQLPKPAAVENQNFTFTGKEQEFLLSGFEADKMTVVGNRQTDANENGYDITISLVDSNNYEWGEDDTAPVTLANVFKISKANLNVTKPSNVQTTYDKSNHFAAVEDVTGAADDKNFTFTVAYGKKENECTNVSLSLVAVGDSGTVYYVVTAGGNYNDASGRYEVTISKAEVTVPSIAAKTYNASVQTADIDADNDLYTVTSNAGGINAQNYDVKIQLKDSNNYKWSDGREDAEITLTFVINKATPILNGGQSGKDSYSPEGNLISEDDIKAAVIGANVYDDAVITYSVTDENSQKIDSVADIKNAGTYTITITVSGDNYVEQVQIYTFTIARATLTKPTEVEGQTFTYNGEPQEFLLEGFNQLTMTVDGNIFKDVPAGGNQTVTVSIADKTNYEWSEGGQSEVTFTFTIAQAALTVTLPTELEFTYDGSDHFKEVTIDGVMGEDKISVQYRGSIDWQDDGWEIKNANGEGTQVDYRIISSDNTLGNYKLSEAQTGSYTIIIYKVSLGRPTAVEKTYTYDKGNVIEFRLENFKADLMNIDGNKQTQANESGYTVTVSLKDDTNYEWSTEKDGSKNDIIEFTFKIAKATYTDIVAPKVENQVNKFGKTLKDVSLASGFHWSEPESSLTLNEHTYDAYYNADPTNYNNYPVTITFITNKEKVSISKLGEGIVESVLGEDVNVGGLIKGFQFLGEDNEPLSAEALNDNIGVVVTGYNKDIGSTYSANIAISLIENDYFEFVADVTTDYVGFIKVKSVYIDETAYTIEDALAMAESGTIIVKGNTAFAEKSVAEKAGYTVEDGNYTVKQGVTLLLPFSDTDTVGFIQPTWKYGDNVTNLPDNDSGITLYQTLTIPADINISNVGTITVGAFTGKRGNNHISNITGNYSMIQLDGTISSSGYLNVYGNIEGTGTIEAIGGTVLERMEILDWPGGTAAGARFVGNGKVNAVSLLNEGGVVTVANPNEFPFESYKLQAINGPTLTIHYGAIYTGNVRIFTGQQEKMGIKIPPMLSIANLNIVNKASGNSADALFGLNPDSTFTKKVETQREQITIHGGFVGGIASINMDLLKGSIYMDTGSVKFPITSQWDIVIDGGNSLSAYGYEFMSGSTLKLQNSATLRLTNTLDGVIAYDGASILVGKDCTLELNGKFGGIVSGEENATLIFNSRNSNSGYIGGGGSYGTSGTDIQFTFTGTSITVEAKGQLESGEGTFKEGTTYYYGSEAWQSGDREFTIEYKFKCKDTDGSVHDCDFVPENSNPSTYTWSGELILQDVEYAEWVFDGWYLDENCADNKISSIIGTEHYGGVTVYGLFVQLSADQLYTISYDTNYPGNKSSDITIAEKTLPVANIDQFNPMENAAIIEAITSKDKDVSVQYYFDKWYLDANHTIEYSAKEFKEMYPNGGVTAILYAGWYSKTKITTSAKSKSTIKITYETNTSTNNCDWWIKPGESVSYEISSSATSGLLGGPTGNWSITGLAEALGKAELAANGSFIVPVNSNVTISATSSDGGSCIVEGTLITLADGTQKPVEELLPTDKVLVFNHYTGKYEACELWSNVHAGNAAELHMITYLKFSDGTELGINYEHGLFDKNLNKYVYITNYNAQEFVGHNFVKVNNVNGEYISSEVTLIGWENVEEYVRVFSPVSLFNMNIVTNGLLTVTAWPCNSSGFESRFEFDENMKYDEEAMQADIEKYGLFTYDDFKDLMTEDLFNALPWKYFKIAIGKGQLTWEDILYTIDWIYTTGQIQLN